MGIIIHTRFIQSLRGIIVDIFFRIFSQECRHSIVWNWFKAEFVSTSQNICLQIIQNGGKRNRCLINNICTPYEIHSRICCGQGTMIYFLKLLQMG